MVYGIYYMVYARVYFTLKNGFLANLSSKKKRKLMHRHRTQAVFFCFHKFYIHIRQPIYFG